MLFQRDPRILLWPANIANPLGIVATQETQSSSPTTSQPISTAQKQAPSPTSLQPVSILSDLGGLSYYVSTETITSLVQVFETESYITKTFSTQWEATPAVGQFAPLLVNSLISAESFSIKDVKDSYNGYCWYPISVNHLDLSLTHACNAF